MKITQTESQLIIKIGGMGQAIAGIIITVLGIAFAVFIIGGFASNNGQKVSPFIGLIGLVIAIAGGLFIKTASNKTCTLVKGGSSSISSTKLVGGATRHQNFDTSSITSVRLLTHFAQDNSSNAGDTNQHRQSDLQLILNNNDIIEVATNSGGSNNFSVGNVNITNLINHAPLSAEAQTIASFLNVPLDAQDMTNPMAVGKSIVTGITEAFASKDTAPGQPIPPASQPATPVVTAAPPANPAPPPSSTVLPAPTIQPSQQPVAIAPAPAQVTSPENPQP